MNLELLLDILELLLELSIYLSLLEEALCSIDLICLPLQFLTLSKQSNRFNLQKLSNLGSIRCSAELRPV